MLDPVPLPSLPCAGCRDVLPKEGGTCAAKKQDGQCGNTVHYTYAYPADGISRYVGAYWCPATCGRCKGDDPQWRTLKPLGDTANPSINPTVFSVGGVKIAVYKSANVFTAYIKAAKSPELHAGPHYHVSCALQCFSTCRQA